MWTKQEEEGEEGKRHDFDDSVDCEASKSKTPFQFDDSFSWEEQAFAEDAAAGRLGGCVWPPRSYSCTFCRREFRSAQALGGHMNVHRRDRARLKQSPNIITNSSAHPHLSTFPAYDLPNPKTHSKAGISCPRVRDKDHVGIGILDEGLNFGFCQPRPTSGLLDDDHEEARVVSGCKRRKMDDETSIQFYVKSSSLVERRHHHHHIQSEVIGLSSSSLHDLDLELRLGGLSKG